MRTKLFLSLLIGLFITVGVSAKNPETTTFSNIETTASGSIKEFTTFTKDTNQPVQRSLYKYDLAGNIQEKVVYGWIDKKGWVGIQKLEYAYENESADKPSQLIYTKWDARTNDWSNKTKKVTYSHNNNESSSTIN